MAFWTKIYSLFRQPTKQVNLKEAKYLPYFDDYDNFPLKWHQAISESPSATACVSTIQDFLEGFGFSDPDLEKKVVNSRGETMFQIHQKTCKDFGEFEGFVWHFMYNSTGQITDWYVLPFENVRLMKPDDNGFISKILYNPYFGTHDYQSYRKDTIFYDVFNPQEVQKQIGALGDKRDSYKGQVLFVGTTTALSRFYPLPEAYAAIKWMGTEKGIADYHEDNINNGMLQPFMLIMRGDPNAPVNNPEAGSTETQQTQAEAFDDVVARNFMGAKRIGNMWVYWVNNPEEKPETLAFPTNNSGDLFLAIDQQSTKKITIAFKVPAILANINEGVSLGGDGNTVRVAVKLMQQRVIKKQRLLTDSYQMILQNMRTPYVQEVTIAPYNPYPELEIVDDKIWNAMSKEEQRDWIEKNTEIELFDGVVTPTAPTEARISNVIPLGWPESIRNKIKKALSYHDKMGIKCISRGGRAISEAVLNNQNLGLRDLKRMYNYLSKRKEFENKMYSEGCDAISYHAWGGEEMEKFLEGKLKDVDQWLN